MPENVVKLFIQSLGRGDRQSEPSWLIENAFRTQSRSGPDPNKDDRIFSVYVTSEVDKKLADLSGPISTKLQNELEARLKAIETKLPADIQKGVKPHMDELFETFNSATAELTKSVVDNVRKDLNRIVEEEVRRILPDLLREMRGDK